MLNVVFSFNLYKVYMVMEDSKDFLISSVGDVTYRMEYRFCQNGFRNRVQNVVQPYISVCGTAVA